MMDINSILDKISAEGIRLNEPLLVAKLAGGCGVEDAAMYDAGKDACENLFISSDMGFDDIAGMEDSTLISEAENGDPLVELTFPRSGAIEVGDFEGFSLVIWNRSGQRLTIAGDSVAPDGFLMLSGVSGEELSRETRSSIA